MTEPLSLQGLRVLVVEDEMMVSMLLEDMLSDLGCAIVGPAGRLEDAMDLAERGGFDCALLDVNLADKQSFPVADLLRSRNTPYAFATGYGEAGLRPEDKGAVLLMKPFRESDLVRVLSVLTGRLTP